MKRTAVYLLKCFVAGIIAIVLLSLFALMYYNLPTNIRQPALITNNRFVPDSNWSYMLEGYGYGKTDSLGYNNTYFDGDFQPDIVCVGSSHLEALQVPHDANCVYLLNEKFDKDGIDENNFKCLNIGMSAHFFEISASNYEYIVNEFKGAKYILVEALDVKFSSSELDKIINGEYHSPIKKNKPKLSYKDIPYYKLLYKKFSEARNAKNTSNTVANGGNLPLKDEYDFSVYEEKMNIVLSKISRISAENNVIPVIFMHENFSVDAEGNVVIGENEIYKKAFKKCCENNGIEVVDVLDEMISNYKQNFEFPYGYSNSVPGKGHLNKMGHEMIAEALYEKINEMEGR